MFPGNFEKVPDDKAVPRFKYCRLDEIGIQIYKYSSAGERKRMKRSHFTHFLFCFAEKRLASKESQGDFEKSNKFEA